MLAPTQKRTAKSKPPAAVACGLALTLLAASLLCVAATASPPPVKGVEGLYVYYGYVPDRIWSIYVTRFSGSQAVEFDVRESSIKDRGYVNIIGDQDGTTVTVYSLTERREVVSLRLDRLQEATVPLPNGTFFKVVSDKPATVTLMGGADVEDKNAIFSTFFTSVEGGYVGKEFIFKALLGRTSGLAFIVYALQPSEVTVSDANGTTVVDFKLEANQFRQLGLTPYANYRLVSSGYVMLQTFTMGYPCFYPSVQGGFVGTVIYGSSSTGLEAWGGSQNYPFFYRKAFITSTEDTKVTVLDEEYEKVNAEFNVVSGSNNSVELRLDRMVVESGKPIVLMYKSDSNIEPGINFMGLKGGQTASLFLPPGGAYLFTAEQTRIEQDGVSFTLPTDSVQPIQEGFHTLTVDRNVILEVVNLADELPFIIPQGKTSGIGSFGAVMPSVQSLSISYPDLSLKPVIEEALPLTYIAAAAVAAIIALVAIMMLRRRTPKRPETASTHR